MADSSCNVTGLLKRASELLNNKLFSDVQIQVKDGSNYKTFPAHKLFLAMGSQEFANIFYNKSDSPSFIKIFDYKPETVYLMLKYLYTDKADFKNIEQAREGYSLAKKYDIQEFQNECSLFLSKEETTLDNLFEKYEFALTENLPDALKICRNLVSSQTLTVLKCPQFTQASTAVVEDILKLDYLSVTTELELIDAAIKWAEAECYRRGSMTESLRICLYPLFKHLRFLTLSASDFCDLVERHENILNSHESTILTMSILQPDSAKRIPSGFSSNTCHRKFPNDAVLSAENQLLKPNSCFNTNTSLSQENKNLDSKFEKPINRAAKFNMEAKTEQQLGSFLEGVEKVKPIGVEDFTDLIKIAQKPRDVISPQNSVSTINRGNVNHQLENFNMNAKTEQQLSSFRNGLGNVEQIGVENFTDFIEYSQKPREVMSPQNSVSTINWGMKSTQTVMKNDKFELLNTSHNVDYVNLNNNKPLGGNVAYPNLNMETGVKKYEKTRKQFPTMTVKPHISMSQNRTFDFPLKELDKCITSASAHDIKCSATVSLTKGSIEIYGIELKIRQMSNSEEMIESILSISGSSFPGLNKSYEEKLKNSVYPISFPNPIKLSQNNHVKIEVIIEDIVLNRCFGYQDDLCEMNCGLNVSADIKMQSNQYHRESRDYFYLISRLIYKPCS